MDPKFCQEYTGAIFRGKLLFVIETWGGVKSSTLDKVQSLQDKAAKIALSGLKINDCLSRLSRQLRLNWLSVQDEVKLATFKMTHKIINNGHPASLKDLMLVNISALRMTIHRKLATKP